MSSPDIYKVRHENDDVKELYKVEFYKHELIHDQATLHDFLIDHDLSFS